MIRPGIRRLIRLVLRSRRAIAREVDDEIRLHLELREAQLRLRGFAPDAAKAEALLRFGVFPEATHRLQRTAQRRERSMNIRERLSEIGQDVTYAVRGLRREPMFTTFIVVTLALGIGANAAMFGVVDRLLLRGPDHVRDPEAVRRIYTLLRVPGSGVITTQSLGYAHYGALLRGSRAFDALAAYRITRDGNTMGRGADAELIALGESTAGFPDLLGSRPLLGRWFTPQEDDIVAPVRVAVISHTLWQRRYEGRADVAGQELRLHDEPYTIIGVMPRGFTGPELGQVDAWIPLSIRSRTVTDNWTSAWDAQWLNVIGRPEPGLTAGQVDEDATAAVRAASEGASAGFRDDFAGMSARPIAFTRRGEESAEARISRWLVGVSAIVLLTACFNVINLLMARATRRRREIAIRIALGAGRWRLTRMLLIEGTVLSLLGGAVALLIATWAGGLIRGVLLPNVVWSSPPVDARVLAVATLVALGVALLTGLVPAVQAATPNLTGALKSRSTGGGELPRMRRVLTVAQAALSVILLIGAGLFVRSLQRVQSLDLGVTPDRVLVISPRFPSINTIADTAARRAEDVRRRSIYTRSLDRLAGVPGVERVSVAIGLPFRSSFRIDLGVPGWDSPPGGQSASISAVGSGYFETVGTRLLRGRTFSPADRAGSEPVAIVNEAMASLLWPGRNAIGECLMIGDGNPPCSRIVGVVANARQNSLREESQMRYYIPFGQESGFGGSQLVLRPEGDPAALIPVIRRELLTLDPSLLFVAIDVMQSYIDPQIRPWRLGASIFVLMGALALIVAAVGLYSVMSYFVVQRTHEIGVRIALGSTGGHVVRLILGSSFAMAAIGVAVGCGVALAAGQFVSDLLFQTSPRDPLVFAIAAVTLLAMAALAGVVPARRARRVDPIVALRSD
jgi:predicted permease